jgi:CheY-like chemotaxis protein
MNIFAQEDSMNNEIEILIVEDSRTQAWQLQHLLEGKGYRVRTTHNGKQALEAADQQQPTLIISDIVMPEMDGYQLCEHIKADPKLRDIPVILLTSLSDLHDVIKGLQCGADNFIIKPYNDRYLLSRVRYMLANRELRQHGRTEMGVEVLFGGKKYFINSERQQILDLLLSTYETAVERNKELIRVQQELSTLNEQLEEKVQERTAALIAEIAERTRAEAALEAERALLAQRIAERTAELSSANAELARAARLKDEFLTGMSHELRTPLNAILGLSEALQEEIYGSLNGQQLKTLQSIEESGRHLLALINDILDLSKIEAGKFDLEISPVAVESVCQAALRLIKQAAFKKQISVTTTFDPAVTSLQADERRLKQILVNLLSNAVKFTPEGGSIGLEVVGDPAQHVARLIVWDTGIGISEADQARLFQPFVQLDSGLDRQYDGTGLGLSLVVRMVDLHGGSVALESEVGKGSRFAVHLPWDGPIAGPAHVAAPAAWLSAVSGFRRALIIEDSQPAAEQISRYFRELGAEIFLHSRGDDALAAARVIQPDLIVLDIELSNVSGWSVLEQLKADPHMRSIPVLMVSVVDERSRGLALGAADYLVKPFSRQQLREALERIGSGLMGTVAQARSVATADQRPSPSAAVILLAEDNEANITTLSDYLSAKGYRVVVARNGAEAIERAREMRPDLILMDIQMPGLDGLEATRRIRAEPSIAAIPIIALTALAMPGDRARCLGAGANDYMSKPVSLQGLVAAIEMQLARSRSEDHTV